jgi:transcriptional regulator with XRE-family HTH domain
MAVHDLPREVRDRLRLTQTELALRLRVSSKTISRWECGITRIHPVYRERLERMLAERPIR